MKSSLNCVVFNREKWGDLFGGAHPDIRSCASKIVSNEDVWVVLTYLHLTGRGVAMTVSDEPLPDVINIVDGLTCHSRYVSSDRFCIGCRSDGPYPGICQMVLHQNRLQAPGGPAEYVPQWPQPGLIARDASREGIQTIGFLGDVHHNCARPFRSPEFVRTLRDMGIGLVLRGKQQQDVSWHDYSDLDLVVAVRDIPFPYLQLKPANKLINAWLAGVPALLGEEPAYRAIRRSSLDFIEVRSPEDVVYAIRALGTRAELYGEMVANGISRAVDYDEDAVARRWLEVLTQASCAFERWRDASTARKLSSYVRRYAIHRIGKMRHNRQVGKYYQRMERTRV